MAECKGSHFALGRLSVFLRSYYRRHGREGYVLKCDIRKFFDSIDHEVLKRRLSGVTDDVRTLRLLCHIIDNYETTPGKGIPMGNQTSQWFALYYLDPLDRLIKEQLRVRYYTRYMDDLVLIWPDKTQLRDFLTPMRTMLGQELKLEFNAKTQIYPLSAGVPYLGWRFSLTDTGRVARRVSRTTKTRFCRRLRRMRLDYSEGSLEWDEVKQVLNRYRAHYPMAMPGGFMEKY